MTNQFDISEFGAVGDGKTDCTAAIQQALDKAGETRGCVLVPPGTYATGRLTLRAHSRMEGKSAWSFREDGASVLKLNAPGAGCLLDITGAYGSTISGICLDGGGLGENTHGVYLYWEKYNGGGQEDTPAIEDCRIGKFTGNGVHLEHIWCFSLRHSMLQGNHGAGLFIDGWDGFIIDNWFTGNKRGGILGGSCAASLTLTGNRVEWNGGGGFLFPHGRAMNITGNYFDRSFGPALRGGTAENGYFSDSAVTGNFFNRSGCPDHQRFASPYENSHVFLTRAGNVTLTGNSFCAGENDGGGGTRSPDYGIVVQNSDAVIVQANTLRHGALKENIFWDGKGDCLVKDNLGRKELPL